METRVTYRASEETVKRLQELSVKYGVSQSALLTMLVNDRWLSENGSPIQGVKSSSSELEPLAVEMGFERAKKKRKRRK